MKELIDFGVFGHFLAELKLHHSCNLTSQPRLLSVLKSDAWSVRCIKHGATQTIISIPSNLYHVIGSQLNPKHHMLYFLTVYIWSEHIQEMWCPQWPISLSLTFFKSHELHISCSGYFSFGHLSLQPKELGIIMEASVVRVLHRSLSSAMCKMVEILYLSIL